jgi:hypothetical protein
MTTIERLRRRKAEIDAKPYTPAGRKTTPPTQRHHYKPVLCITTGKRFPSLLDAAEWLSDHLQERCGSSAIGFAIRQGRIYKGFRFKYE